MTLRPLPDPPPRPANAIELTERASATDPLRTRFLRRVAHDIASPAGVTSTVLEELAAESGRPELVAMARRGLKRLLRLSEQLALVAELEGGPVVPELAPEDVRDLVHGALDHATFVDGRRDVQVTSDLPDRRVLVTADRRLFVCVLREIIGNALRLASSRVWVQVEEAEGQVRIRVHDDGPGFSAEALAGLGRRFTESSCARGLGLSLSIAKEVLAGHRADLAIETSALPPGRRGVKGACVVVTLPCLD